MDAGRLTLHQDRLVWTRNKGLFELFGLWPGIRKLEIEKTEVLEVNINRSRVWGSTIELKLTKLRRYAFEVGSGFYLTVRETFGLFPINLLWNGNSDAEEWYRLLSDWVNH